jgi:hypothetical protein
MRTPFGRRRRGLLLASLVCASVLVVPGQRALAESGGLELALDRAAVAAIIRAGIPAPRPYPVPGIGQATIALDAPETVDFRDGGLEAMIGVRVLELGLSGRVALRYEPQLDAETGIVRLRPVRGRFDGPLSALPDIAPLLPSVSVPQQWAGELEPRGGVRTEVSVRVRDVRIGDERLFVRLGLDTRRLD